MSDFTRLLKIGRKLVEKGIDKLCLPWYTTGMGIKQNTSQKERTMDLDVMCGMYKLSPEPHSWPSHVVAYHLTPANNVETILANGLTAKPCKATHNGAARTAAVYLLAHKGDTQDANIRDFLFDEGVEIAVLEITIPRSAFENLQRDGLFNMSCICVDGSYPFGVQYIDNIPAEWIKHQLIDLGMS